MAESNFISTVAFGGYDITETDNRINKLSEENTALRNKLRESEILLDEFKSGSDSQKAQNAVLDEERAKLTKIQVENKTLTDKLKITEDNNKKLTAQVDELTKKVDELTAKFDEASQKLQAAESGSDPQALSVVFIEAQKSANMLVEKAKKDAAKSEENSKTVAENTVTAANNKAKKIIYDAEKQAAEIIAEAKNNSEKISAASGNLKSVILSDVTGLSEEISKLKDVLESFRETGLEKISKATEILEKTDKKIKEGGVPEFKNPEKIQPDYPKEPEYEKLKNQPAKNEQNDELSKLMAMAQALDSNDSKKEKADNKADKKEETKNEKKKSGGISLEELAAQAAALNNK